MTIDDINPGQHVIHKKTGGHYVIVGRGRLEYDIDKRIVAYRKINEIDLWIRPLEEFLDGRFILTEGQLG